MTKIIILNLFLFFACESKIDNYKFNLQEKGNLSKEEAVKIIKSKNKFAFIRKHSLDDKRPAQIDGFGDIFIYNIEDSTLYRATDDNSYERFLCWSPDGTKLLFASSRDFYDRRIHDNSQGMKVKKLYIYNLNTGIIKPLNSTKRVYDFFGLTWLKDGIYFANYKNIVYRLSIDGSNLTSFITLDEKVKIYNFSFSRTGKYISLELKSLKPPYHTTIGIYDVELKEYSGVIENRGSLTLGGWHPKEDSFLFSKRDTVFKYNITNSEEEILPLIGNMNKLMVKQCYYLNSECVIYNSMENPYKLNADKRRDLQIGVAIGVEDLKTKLIWYPVFDYNIKTDLAPYYKL